MKTMRKSGGRKAIHERTHGMLVGLVLFVGLAATGAALAARVGRAADRDLLREAAGSHGSGPQIDAKVVPGGTTPRAEGGEVQLIPDDSNPRAIDWDLPISGGIEVAESEVKDYLGYEGIIPSGIGTPLRVLVDDPKQVAATSRAAAFIFDDPNYGRFHVWVQPMETSQALMEQQVLNNVIEGNSAEYSVVDIRGGIRALLASGPRGTSVTGLVGEAEVVIIGPSSTLTPEAAVALANQMEY